MKFYFLWSDVLLWGLFIVIAMAVALSMRYPFWRRPWLKLINGNLSSAAALVVLFYVVIGLLDSIHFQMVNASGYELRSLLDLLINPLGQQLEISYSAPFAKYLYSSSPIKQPLIYVHGNTSNIWMRFGIGFAIGLGLAILVLIIFLCSFRNRQHSFRVKVAWTSLWITFTIIAIMVAIASMLATHYHILGTDKIGQDVFYLTLKSIRTGLIIGSITTLFMLPFGLFLGTIAGYFRGWLDDIIQYCYTTLSSIPAVLLISASVLVLQVYISKNAGNYNTLAQRADLRLLALCFILAITGWSDLCRYLRAETLKLRELEFVQAAKALGVREFTIVLRHIMPNVFHILLITLVLDFSTLVLAEAVLSYVGVGVDPTTISWGNMINSSRLELAREPVVWWPLIAALFSMFGLVLSANIFADAVRDAFDPYIL
jgi:peptide/nickel transport system permease protein